MPAEVIEGDVWLAALLGRAIADPLPEGAQRAKVVIPRPLGDALGRGPAAGIGQRVRDRPSGDEDEGREQREDHPHHDAATLRWPAAPPARPPRPRPRLTSRCYWSSHAV